MWDFRSSSVSLSTPSLDKCARQPADLAVWRPGSQWWFPAHDTYGRRSISSEANGAQWGAGTLRWPEGDGGRDSVWPRGWGARAHRRSKKYKDNEGRQALALQETSKLADRTESTAKEGKQGKSHKVCGAQRQAVACSVHKHTSLGLKRVPSASFAWGHGFVHSGPRAVPGMEWTLGKYLLMNRMP